MQPVRVSLDFDNTLSRPDVQEYARELLANGIVVWVVTARYDENHKHRYPLNPSNEDLYAVTDELGIPRERIRFCNMRPKAEYLAHTSFAFHLDDDEVELRSIIGAANTPPAIDSTNPYWRRICNNHLGHVPNLILTLA